MEEMERRATEAEILMARWPGDPAARAAAIGEHLRELVPVHWPDEDTPAVSS